MSDRPPFGIIYREEIAAGLVHELTEADLKVLVVLRAWRWEPENKTFELDRKEIAALAGIDERTVPKALRRLEKHGHIRITAGGVGQTNKYVIEFPTVKGAPRGTFDQVERCPAGARKVPAERAKGAPPVRASKEVRREETKNHGGSRPDGGGEVHSPDPLRNVQADQLRDRWWLSQLARELLEAGRLTGEFAQVRLKVVAAAKHATRVGQKNPPALFASIVRERDWSKISNEDEQAAIALLNRPRSRPYTPHDACGR